MKVILEMLSYPFLVRALVVGVLVSQNLFHGRSKPVI